MILLIFSAIGGLLFGAVVAVSLTALDIKKKITQKSVTDYSQNVGEAQKEEVESLIKEYTAKYDRNAKGMITGMTLGLKRRKKKSGDKSGKVDKEKSVDYMGLINEVAKVFRPSAYKPFLDLSEKQIFAFSREIISKVRAMLDASGLEIVKTVHVSTVLGATNLSQAIMNGETMKVAKAFGKCKKAIDYVGIINPVRYIKNYLNAVFICGTIKSVMRCTIRVVATETANLFSAPEK